MQVPVPGVGASAVCAGTGPGVGAAARCLVSPQLLLCYCARAFVTRCRRCMLVLLSGAHACITFFFFLECVAKGSRLTWESEGIGVFARRCFRVRNRSQPFASVPSPMALPLGRALKSDFSWMCRVSVCAAIAKKWHVMQER